MSQQIFSVTVSAITSKYPVSKIVVDLSSFTCLTTTIIQNRNHNSTVRSRGLTSDISYTYWMKEQEILDNLDSISENNLKLATIEYLRSVAPSGHLPVSNIPLLFKRMRSLIQDSSNTIVYSVLSWLIDISPYFTSPDIFGEYVRILPRLVHTLAHPKHAIRKCSLILLQGMMPAASKFVLTEIITGCQEEQSRVRRECVQSLQYLMSSENYLRASEEMNLIIPALVDRLRDISPSVIQASAAVLGYLRISYSQEFEAQIEALPENLKQLYDVYEDKLDDAFIFSSVPLDESSSSIPSGRLSKLSTRASSSTGGGADLEFGFLPIAIVRKCQSSDERAVAAGVNALQRIIADLDAPLQTIQDMSAFLKFLQSLLENSNYKIVLVALNIVDDFATKVDHVGKEVVKSLDISLLKHLGDKRSVIRQYSMRVFNSLMARASVKPIISLCIPKMTHKDPRIREQTINLMMSAVLQYPDGGHDFDFLLEATECCLSDSDDLVKSAAMDALTIMCHLSPVTMRRLPRDLQTEIKFRISNNALASVTVDGLIVPGQKRPTSDAEDRAFPKRNITEQQLSATLPPHFQYSEEKVAIKLPQIVKDTQNRPINPSSNTGQFGGAEVESIAMQRMTLDFETPASGQPKKASLSQATVKRLAAKGQLPPSLVSAKSSDKIADTPTLKTSSSSTLDDALDSAVVTLKHRAPRSKSSASTDPSSATRALPRSKTLTMRAASRLSKPAAPAASIPV
eukprot:Partr_v1_DN28357_c0_g1_i3_m79406 putative family with sequence similarity 179, member